MGDVSGRGAFRRRAPGARRQSRRRRRKPRSGRGMRRAGHPRGETGDRRPARGRAGRPHPAPLGALGVVVGAVRGGDLPWDVPCRGVVDGIAMVIHMTRADGRRVVEDAAFVRGYDAGTNQWDRQRHRPGRGGADVRRHARCAYLAGGARTHLARPAGSTRRAGLA